MAHWFRGISTQHLNALVKFPSVSSTNLAVVDTPLWAKGHQVQVTIQALGNGVINHRP